MFYFGRLAMGRLPVFCLCCPLDVDVVCVNRFGTLADSLGKTTVIIANGTETSRQQAGGIFILKH